MLVRQEWGVNEKESLGENYGNCSFKEKNTESRVFVKILNKKNGKEKLIKGVLASQ